LGTTKALRWREGTKENFTAQLNDAHYETAWLHIKKTQMPYRGYHLVATKLQSSKPRAQGGFGDRNAFALGMEGGVVGNKGPGVFLLHVVQLC
jgi:hypothetical protein